MASLIDDLKRFSGRRVLITGHTGFKGSWLTLLMLKAGARVSGYALPPATDPSHWQLLNLTGEVESHEQDIRDLSALESVMRQCRPEVVFHLAAQALVRASYRDPYGTFSTNILGSANVLEAVSRQPSVQTLVYITSDKCYKNKEQLRGYVESDELGGIDPYSASKAAAEHVFSGYMNSVFQVPDSVRAASARAGNVVGGGDWSQDRLIPDCIRSATGSRVINLRFPQATRPWQHVLEPLSGYVRLAVALQEQQLPHGAAWNFGPPEESVHQVKEVTEILVQRWDARVTTNIEGSTSNFHEAGLLQLNSEKAHTLLDWRPRWSFQETIERTTDWYRQFYSGTDARDLSMADIGAYCQT